MTEVRVPSLPESVADATVLTWHKQPGDTVKTRDNLVDLETDKVILEVPAPVDGVLGAILAREGTIVQADTPLALIEPDAASLANTDVQADRRAGAPPPASGARQPARQVTEPPRPSANERHPPPQAPAARRLIKELALDPSAISGSGKDGRIHKADVVAWLDRREQSDTESDPDGIPLLEPAPPGLSGEAGRPEQRVPMTRLRARIAERLVQAQQNAAILTTFNEIDMSAVIALRDRYRKRFEQTHGTRLGFMSFFVKATVEALQRFPVINASIDAGDILYHGYFDIGIAVSSPRGLVVPILRNCDQLTMAEIERGIADFSAKAKDGTLSFEELTGGTFSITNGGIFGSLLSTPIINPPQSAILGMHQIQQRPVALDGQIAVRPMMYLAFSYDHRLIDGRDAVQCLVCIKEMIEDPARLLLRV